MAGGLGCGDEDNSHLKQDHSLGKKICREQKSCKTKEKQSAYLYQA